MGFLKDKKILITGVASTRSIAWGIAQAMHGRAPRSPSVTRATSCRAGPRKWPPSVDRSWCCPWTFPATPRSATALRPLAQHWDGLDGIVHSIGFAPRDQLEGDYVDAVTREGFAIAHDISSYSFAALAKAGRDMMAGRNGALLTLSYLGAERAVPNYNVMGLAKASLEANVRYLAASLGPKGTRVNAISAGPIRTLAASGISDFRSMLKQVEERPPCAATSPSKRSATPPPSSAPTWPPASPARSSTWIPATTFWGSANPRAPAVGLCPRKESSAANARKYTRMKNDLPS